MDNRSGVQLHRYGPLTLYALSIVVGIVGALAAVVFRGMIAFFHNLIFLRQFSVFYDANIHTPSSPWGPFIILGPVIGAVGVVFLVRTFAPEAKGHGVPEVMDANYYHKGAIRPVVAFVKSLASALSIGSGGSVGREGPIIQIGSSFGSTLGQLFNTVVWQRITLIAAGAGAGIAATFNTPIGGVLFAVEIMLDEISHRTLVPVIIATATASYLGRLMLGDHPSFVIHGFEIPNFHPTDPYVLVFYVVLGVLMGLVSVTYIRAIYATEDFFDKRVPGNDYVHHISGMFLVGVLMYLLLLTTGHYQIEGVGYATVQDVLQGELSWFLLALFVLKLLAVSLTLGSGASGGVFSPALFMGATLGGVFGMLVQQLFPGLPIQPSAFAVAGMAGAVGGSTGAALTAIVMIFEMTMDYTVIIPITITVALSYGIRRLLQRESIYTLKLARRGHYVPASLQANLHYLKPAKKLMDSHFTILPAGAEVTSWLQAAAEHSGDHWFLIEGPGGVVGLLTRDSAARPSDLQSHAAKLDDLIDKRFVFVGENDQLLQVMSRMRAAGAKAALVTAQPGDSSAQNVLGVIGKPQIADAVLGGLELFSD